MGQERIFLIAAAALGIAGCSAGHAEDGGPQVSKVFPVGNFTKLEVAGPYDVTVVTGKAASARAEGPQKLIDKLEVVVDGDELKVRTIRKGWLDWSWNGGSAKVAITVPSLEEARVAGSGDTSIDKVAGERFSGSIAGSGGLRVGSASVKKLTLQIQGSGGTIISGQAEEARYSIQGSGDVDASKLSAKRAEASIAGSGNIRAHATESAKANIAGSGNIEITGGAKCETSKQGSGNISCS